MNPEAGPERPDTRRRAGSDAAVIALGYLTSFVYPLVSLPFLARMLGVGALGTVMLLLAVLQLVVHVTDFGFSISALRRASVTRDATVRSRILVETVLAKTFIWAVCAGLMVGVVLAVPLLHDHLWALLLGLVLVLIGAWYPGWMLQAMGRMTTFALIMAGSRLLALIGLLATVRDTEHMDLALAWQLAPQAFAAVIAWFLLLRGWKAVHLVRVGRRAVMEALRESAPLFISNAAVVVTGSASALSLGAFSTNPQVAFYGAAERFGNAVRGVMRGVSDAMLPRMTAGSTPAVRRFVTAALPLTYGAAGLCLIGASGWFVPWYLGADMAQAVGPTRLMGLALLLAGITATLTLHANAAHRYGTVASLTGVGAIVHAALCIPGALLAGAVGVAAALVCSEALLALLFGIDALRRRISARREEDPAAASVPVAHDPAALEPALDPAVHDPSARPGGMTPSVPAPQEVSP